MVLMSKYLKQIPECSFCGKTVKEVEKLLTGENANICNECVLLYKQKLSETQEK